MGRIHLEGSIVNVQDLARLPYRLWFPSMSKMLRQFVARVRILCPPLM